MVRFRFPSSLRREDIFFEGPQLNWKKKKKERKTNILKYKVYTFNVSVANVNYTLILCIDFNFAFICMRWLWNDENILSSPR